MSKRKMKLEKSIDASNRSVSNELRARRGKVIGHRVATPAETAAIDRAARPEVFITKLGTAKRVERSRIWIEGRRLVEAGFTVGSYFVKSWEIKDRYEAAMEGRDPYVTLTLTLLKDSDVLATAPCKVSGKADKPIIDITGEMVRRQFGTDWTHVAVTFSKGKIVIRPYFGTQR